MRPQTQGETMGSIRLTWEKRIHRAGWLGQQAGAMALIFAAFCAGAGVWGSCRQEHTGILSRETPEAVYLKTAQKQEVRIARSENRRDQSEQGFHHAARHGQSNAARRNPRPDRVSAISEVV